MFWKQKNLNFCQWECIIILQVLSFLWIAESWLLYGFQKLWNHWFQSKLERFLLPLGVFPHEKNSTHYFIFFCPIFFMNRGNKNTYIKGRRIRWFFICVWSHQKKRTCLFVSWSFQSRLTCCLRYCSFQSLLITNIYNSQKNHVNTSGIQWRWFILNVYLNGKIITLHPCWDA